MKSMLLPSQMDPGTNANEMKHRRVFSASVAPALQGVI